MMYRWCWMVLVGACPWAGCQSASQPEAVPASAVPPDSTAFQLLTATEPPDPAFFFGCNAIYQDRRGRMWFGFTGGLYRLEGEVFVNVRRGGPWE